MQSTNFDNSLDMKPVSFEHNYCRNGDIRDVEDRKHCAYNVFGKKRSRHFGAVDKWTHRLLVNVTTGGNWNKIVDRETAILKVQYPFLPEQQLRGKAYKKFGIPTVMGGALSQAIAMFEGADRTSRHQDVKKSKNLSQFDSSDENGLPELIGGSINCKIGLKEDVPPEIDDAVPNTRRSTIGTNDTESLTPSFGILDTTSIFSKPTQRFKQYTRPSDTPDGIYSASTKKTEQDFQRFHNRGDVNDNLTGGSSSQCEISLLNDLSIDSSASIGSISSTEMLTHKNIENNNRHVTYPRKAKAESFSLRAPLGFPRKTSNEQQNGPIFDIVDIGDFSQLATPNFGHFELPKLSASQSPSDPSHNDSFNNYRNTPEEPRQISINNELKRKRKADRGVITSTEDKENDPAIINFQHEKLRPKKLGLSTNAKNPFAFHDTLTLVLQARDLNLNGPSEKSGDASSPDIASPENKKRRLSLSQDWPISASFHPRGRKKRLHIVDVTQEKNTAEEPSVELSYNAEEKPSAKPTSEVKLPTIASNGSWEVETTSELSLDVVGDDGNQNVAQKLMTDDKRPAIIVENSSGQSGDAFSSDSRSPEMTKRRLSLQDSPISASFHPRGRKERIHIVGVTQEKNTAEEPSEELRNNAEEKPSAKPASEVKLPTIASNDSWEVETTAESSLDVVGDDGNQNVAQKLMTDVKRSAIIVKNSSEKSGDTFSSDSASPEMTKRRRSLQDSSTLVAKNCGSTPFYPRRRKKRVVHCIPIVDLTREDDTNVCNSFNDEETEKNTGKSGDAFSSDSASSEIKNRRQSCESSPIFYIENCGPFYPRGKKESVDFVDLTQENDTNVCKSFNNEYKEKNTAEESSVMPRNNAQQKRSAKPVSDIKLEMITSNDDCDIEMIAESWLDVDGDSGKQNVSQNSTADEKRSAIDLNDALDPEATIESLLVSPTDDDESSPSSATTNFTQTSSFSSTLLSDRCSEYDQCLQDENLSHRNLAENTIGVSNFIAKFDVDIDIIHQQVDNILTFLEADIDSN